MVTSTVLAPAVYFALAPEVITVATLDTTVLLAKAAQYAVPLFAAALKPKLKLIELRVFALLIDVITGARGSRVGEAKSNKLVSKWTKIIH